MNIIWTRSAKKDVIVFLEMLKNENPVLLKKWKEKIEERISSLALFPNLGKVYKIENYRELIISPFRILYEVDSENIYIMVFQHERKNFKLK